MIELDLTQLFIALKKKAWLLILAATLCGVCAFGITKYAITPMYKSDVKMYVNNSSISVGSTQLSISGSDISAAQTLVDTYIVILQSRTVLEAVIEQANLPYSVDQLSRMVTASSINGTEIFQIQTVNPDPQMAMRIANTVADVLPDKISTIVDGSSVRVVDYAIEAAAAYSPNYTQNIVLGILFGLLISCGFVVLTSIFNDTIDNEDILTQSFDIPVLSVIPDIHSSKAKGNYYRGGYYAPDQKGGA